MPAKLFPTLDYSRTDIVNLNDAAIEWTSSRGILSENPLLDPDVTQSMVDELHRKLGLVWSFGSYMEDRSTLLRGSYLEETGSFLHLGIDCNVPPNTPVAAPYDATIIDIFDDGDEPQGWGPRLILEARDKVLYPEYLVLAHFKPLSLAVGQSVVAGSVLESIAAPPRNGYWFPHLHVQLIRPSKGIELKEKTFFGLDGYGHPNDKGILEQDFPDPAWLLIPR